MPDLTACVRQAEYFKSNNNKNNNNSDDDDDDGDEDENESDVVSNNNNNNTTTTTTTTITLKGAFLGSAIYALSREFPRTSRLRGNGAKHE